MNIVYKNINTLNIVYKNINIKQHSSVTYLGCILDETLSGESMALNVLSKINSRLKFLYRKNRYLTLPLRRLLCNALIQPHFDYACSAWYPNLSKNLKKKLQVTQNKCIRFRLQLGWRSHIGANEFEEINWLTINDRFFQCVNSSIHKFFNNKCPAYMKEVYCPVGQNSVNTRSSHLKLMQPSRRTNHGLKSLSYIGPSTWNKLPDNIKEVSDLNTFKHKLKTQFLLDLKKREKDIFIY